MSKGAHQSRAIETVLTIIMFGAGGLLLLLIFALVTGSVGRFAPPVENPADFGLGPGKKAPAIVADAWLNGEPVADAKKPMLVQAWFYECPFCWREAPEIVKLSEQFGDRIDFVALSPDPVSTEEQVQEFIDTNQITYPVGYGAQATLNGFEVRGYPSLWLVGPDGTILWNLASRHEQPLEEAIEAVLATPST